MNTKQILSSIFLSLSLGLFAENGVITTNKETENTTVLTIPTNNEVATSKGAEAIVYNGGGDGYDDEFRFSKRIRRFHHSNSRGGGGYQSWGYYDPYYSSDVYYMVNTPAWNSYYYGGYYGAPMTTVIVRPTFWGVLAAVMFAPTYYNYGYYNPSPVGWGYYGGQGYYNGWNQCYWGSGYGYGYQNGFYNGYNQGYNNGYYNGYNNGYYNGYNQGYNDGFYNGGGYANGDDWWYWKNQGPRTNGNAGSTKGGTQNAIPTGGKHDLGMSQTSIVKPNKGEIGVQTGNLADKPVTFPSHSSMNSKPITEGVRNESVKWDTQTGDEPIRNQTQPSRPSWSSEPSRPSQTSPAYQTGAEPIRNQTQPSRPSWSSEPSRPSQQTSPAYQSTSPQGTVGSRPQNATMPSQPARPQSQMNGNRPESNSNGSQFESRPNPNFDNRPNNSNYENAQSSPYSSGSRSNPTTSGRPYGERSNYDAPRSPQNGHNVGSFQNQPSMSKPQHQAAPSNARPQSPAGNNQVKLPAPSGKRGGLSYNPTPIVP